jgi:hypothetical protein
LFERRDRDFYCLGAKQNLQAVNWLGDATGVLLERKHKKTNGENEYRTESIRNPITVIHFKQYEYNNYILSHILTHEETHRRLM